MMPVCCWLANRFYRGGHLPWTDHCARCVHWDCALTRLHLVLTGERVGS